MGRWVIRLQVRHSDVSLSNTMAGPAADPGFFIGRPAAGIRVRTAAIASKSRRYAAVVCGEGLRVARSARNETHENTPAGRRRCETVQDLTRAARRVA